MAIYLPNTQKLPVEQAIAIVAANREINITPALVTLIQQAITSLRKSGLHDGLRSALGPFGIVLLAATGSTISFCEQTTPAAAI